MTLKVKIFLFLLGMMVCVQAQDLGNGMYQNPILYADYSDPDAIRVGRDYYMTSSSFNCSPGLQILHSVDLVNWELVSAALPHAIPGGKGVVVEHGNQVWAPSIRYHKGMFYVVWGDPDVGIFQVHAKDVKGPWSEPVLLLPAKGFIDPTPLWDENGRTWLVHAMAGSRAGLKSVLCLAEVNEDLTQVVNPSRIIFDGHAEHPTCEGPKLYKKDGYYYIFTPAGGVSTGWQLVLRSKSVYGPYEEKVVLAQGNTEVNAPHQGAWVTTPKGEDWFLHFQDVGPLGRIVHLQPMTWKNGWPVIGQDPDGDGCGEPVVTYKKPETSKRAAQNVYSGSDDFSSGVLDWKWQWHGSPDARWFFLDAAHSCLRLYANPERLTEDSLGDASNLWNIPHVLLQKPYAPQETIIAKVKLSPSAKYTGERGGLVMMGMDYAGLVLANTDRGIVLQQIKCLKANKSGEEVVVESVPWTEQWAYLCLHFETLPMNPNATNTDRVVVATFSFSPDGITYQPIGESFNVRPGQWIGAKYGLFCTRPGVKTNDSGWLDVYEWIVK